MSNSITDVTFPRPFLFTVVVPCYNEEESLRQSVEGLLAIQDDMLTLEVLIVDDCSRDRSREIARELAGEHDCIRLLEHAENQGKGGALQTGFAAATGDFVGVHDADLEYDPLDLRQLLVPLVDGRADAVLGSRYLNATGTRRVLYFYHTMINKGLTFVSNMFTDLDLTDMETCYKVYKRELIQSFDLKEKRFGIEPEMVSNLAHSKARVYERGISYDGRTYEEGKKIGCGTACAPCTACSTTTPTARRCPATAHLFLHRPGRGHRQHRRLRGPAPGHVRGLGGHPGLRRGRSGQLLAVHQDSLPPQGALERFRGTHGLRGVRGRALRGGRGHHGGPCRAGHGRPWCQTHRHPDRILLNFIARKMLVFPESKLRM